MTSNVTVAKTEPDMCFNDALNAVNRDIASSGIRLRVEKRGKFLNIRGVLPSRYSKENYKSQRISLRLAANKQGLEEAKKIVTLIDFQLKHNQFSWESWAHPKQESKISRKKTELDELSAFKLSFFNEPKNKRTDYGSRTTWTSSYLPYLRRFREIQQQSNCKINDGVFLETLLTYKANSRSRQQCAIALGALANHLGINLPENWRSLSYGYGLHNARFRDLPSDNLIKEAWMKIPNVQWKKVYGLMATYGLRNHEVFFSDLSSLSFNGDKVIRVLPNTKTGEHQCWPFHPDWVNIFGLEELGEGVESLPSINTDLKYTTLQKVGRRVTEQFKRYKLPLTPYDLRHAWAVRTIHIGLPDTVAARMMGHSVAIHTKTYHHWITRRDQQQAVDAALASKAC